MESLGIQFCFFPVLSLLGLASLLLGFVHLFLCLPFYFLVVGVVNGVLLLVITFHGCFLSYPTRGHCLLHVLGMLWAIVVAVLCSLELFCIVPDDQRRRPIATDSSVCYGVRSRTKYVTAACLDSIGVFRHSFSKLFWSLSETDIERIVAGGQAVVGLVQIVCCGAMAWWCSIESDMRMRGYHAQIILAFVIAILGCIHTLFCCMYFYIGFAVWSSALILIQALITLKSRGSARLARGVNLVGAGLGMALTAINVFGLFCWFEGLHNSSDWAFRWHCVYRHETYHWCERRIHFARPYTDWPQHLVQAELRNFQLVAYVGLIGCGLIQLVISLHSLFRKVRP